MSSNVPIRLVLLFPILLLLLDTPIVHGQSNVDGRTLLVMSAPSVWDTAYETIFLDIINTQISIANAIRGRDNVVILVDKHTRPYYDGSNEKVKAKLPNDFLLSADIYDVTIRDFAPLGIREFAKFEFGNPSIDGMFSHQVDMSMRRFLAAHELRLGRDEEKLMLTAADIVDNGVNKAIVNERVIEDNLDVLPDWATKVKMLSVFKQVAYAPLPVHPNATANTTRRMDDYISFIDEDVLLTVDMLEEQLETLKDQMRRRLYQEVTTVALPVGHRHDDEEGSCGMYTGMVSTENYLYMPAYGNDPANWAMGHSSRMDKHIAQIVQANSRKVVVPVTMPRALCANSINIRSLCWTVKGEQAQTLLDAARLSHRRKALLQ